VDPWLQTPEFVAAVRQTMSERRIDFPQVGPVFPRVHLFLPHALPLSPHVVPLSIFLISLKKERDKRQARRKTPATLNFVLKTLFKPT
jgi:hypothetical protein